MKKVEAIFRPEKLEDVRGALDGLERVGMTVIEVKGHGVQGGLSQRWRGEEYHVSLVPKVMVLAVVHDHEVTETIETIVAATRSGVMGDGKIFVTPVEHAVRIRTGESGPQAI
ncbi:MAG: P-II family nitrogen regulator [Actinomycetota bacterium]|nr:P-II family nitrogen regulator [Actinomycetota bacterium]MDZ4178826.1 P-II family nitrogen regulator [Coriobacteriia bacterium]